MPDEWGCNMKKILLCAMLAVCATSAVSQIHFKVGDVEIKQRELRPSDVRAFIDRKDYKNAKDIALQCAKETGDGWCEFYAGQLTYGAPGLEPDEKEGLRLIQSSATKDVSSAQVFIGDLYFNGIGMPKDPSQALVWWTRAANNCNAWAQNALARTYYDGEHAPKDLLEAFYWVTLAAYYRFPGSDKGEEVLAELLSHEQKQQVSRRVKKFIQGSGCGDSPQRPVVHEGE